MLSQVTRLSRIERWLYNGLHSLDFPFWYDMRPAWDIVMIVLLLGGLISSSVGFVLGILARGARSAAPRARPRWSPGAGDFTSREGCLNANRLVDARGVRGGRRGVLSEQAG